MPSTIQTLHQEYKDRGLVVLPISIEEGRKKVGPWVEKNKAVVTPMLLDPEGDASGAYRITATPTAFLVGRDGKLIAKAIGTKPWTSDQGHALLKLLLSR